MDLEDLSDYCVVKKYRDGWLVYSTHKDWNCRFVSNQHLIRMGYLSKSNTVNVNDPPHASIIVVPPISKHQPQLQ